MWGERSERETTDVIVYRDKCVCARTHTEHTRRLSTRESAAAGRGARARRAGGGGHGATGDGNSQHTAAPRARETPPARACVCSPTPYTYQNFQILKCEETHTTRVASVRTLLVSTPRE